MKGQNYNRTRIVIILLTFITLTAYSKSGLANTAIHNLNSNDVLVPPSSEWQQIPEGKIINLKDSKDLFKDSQIYFSFDGTCLDSENTRSGDNGTTVKVTVDVEDFKYLDDIIECACYVYSRSAKAMVTATPEEEDWVFNSPLVASNLPAANDYVALVNLHGLVSDYKGDGTEYEVLISSFVKDVRVEGESVDVTVDMSDAKIELEFIPVDPAGVPFPSIEMGSDLYSLSATSLSIFGLNIRLFNGINFPFVRITPPLDQNSVFEGQAYMMYPDEPDFYVMKNITQGPFKEDTVFTNNPDDYIEYSSDFSLTSQDSECLNSGIGYINTKIISDSMGVHTRLSTLGYGRNGESPFSEVHVFACMPDPVDSTVLESVMATYVRTMYIPSYSIEESKVSGNFAKDKDGNQVIIGNNICRDGNNSYTLFSPVPEFNIYSSSQKIVNFYNSLFASASLQLIGTDDGEHLDYLGVRLVPTGYFHEYISLINPEVYFKYVKHNGKNVNLNFIFAQSFKDAEYEIAFQYDNVLVEDNFPSSAKVILGVNTRGEDLQSPQLVNFQIRDGKNNICTRIPTNEIGKLILAANDNSGRVASIEIFVAPDGSEDFQPLEAEVIANDDLQGSYAIADLTGLNHDIFYTVKVIAKDEADNYCENTIFYAFNITDRPSGISSVGRSYNTEAELYNLQGIRISKPEQGQFYIVKRGNQVHKEIYNM